MNAYLAEIAKTVAPSAHAVLGIDGAGWRGSSTLRIPGSITIVATPPNAPELEPVENICAHLQANHLAITVFDPYVDVEEQCCDAWNAFANVPASVRSMATIKYAKAFDVLGPWY